MLSPVKHVLADWSTFEFDVPVAAKAALNAAMGGLPGLVAQPFAVATRDLGGMHYSFLCRVQPRGRLGPVCIKKVQVYAPETGTPYLTQFVDVRP